MSRPARSFRRRSQRRKCGTTELFGLSFDVGHVWLVDAKDPLAWLEELGDRVVVIHLHGTFYRPDRGFINHHTLEEDDCTDLPALMSKLDDLGFDGGINLELHAPDIPSYLDMGRRNRKIILSAAGLEG